jgi:hypothetical protein
MFILGSESDCAGMLDDSSFDVLMIKRSKTLSRQNFKQLVVVRAYMNEIPVLKQA